MLPTRRMHLRKSAKTLKCRSTCIQYLPPHAALHMPEEFDSDPLIIKSKEILGSHIFTKIQCLMASAILSYHDMVSIGEGNTGKTLGYLLPILARTMCAAQDTTTIIVCPTKKEIVKVVLQIKCFLKGYNFTLPIASCITVPLPDTQKPVFIIATPGELSQYQDAYSRCSVLVLENVEEMPLNSYHILASALETFNKNKPQLSQIIVIAKNWSFPVSKLISQFVTQPVVAFANYVDALLYKNIKIHIHLPLEEDNLPQDLKTILKTYRGFSPTVICASSSAITKQISHYHTCISVIERNNPQTKVFLNEFKRNPTRVVLLVVDSVLELIENDVGNVSNLIHLGVPDHYETFEQRMKLLLPSDTATSTLARCHIYPTEEDFDKDYFFELKRRMSEFNNNEKLCTNLLAQNEVERLSERLPPYYTHDFIFEDIPDADFISEFAKEFEKD